jgi:hypothetical protein
MFEEPVQTESGDRCIGLSCDISGSMSGSMKGLKVAGAAIAKATEIVGDEFVWEAFTDVTSGHGSDTAISGEVRDLELKIVTGPRESFEWEHTESIWASANEPTASGVRHTRQLMEMTSANEYLMIVITDGCALITEDGRKPADNEPVEQAREAVEECRQAGIDVIGLGIGGMDEERMEDTFGGGNYILTTIDKLADDIVDLYRKQMHTAN